MKHVTALMLTLISCSASNGATPSQEDTGGSSNTVNTSSTATGGTNSSLVATGGTNSVLTATGGGSPYAASCLQAVSNGITNYSSVGCGSETAAYCQYACFAKNCYISLYNYPQATVDAQVHSYLCLAKQTNESCVTMSLPTDCTTGTGGTSSTGSTTQVSCYTETTIGSTIECTVANFTADFCTTYQKDWLSAGIGNEVNSIPTSCNRPASIPSTNLWCCGKDSVGWCTCMNTSTTTCSALATAESWTLASSCP